MYMMFAEHILQIAAIYKCIRILHIIECHISAFNLMVNHKKSIIDLEISRCMVGATQQMVTNVTKPNATFNC